MIYCTRGICLTLAILALVMAPMATPLSAQTGDEKKPGAKEAPGKDVFGLSKLHDFHVELTAKEWAAMQEVKGGFPMFGKGFEKPPEKPAEKTDTHKGGGFGTEFPWVHAEFTAEGKTYKNVGLRYKGNASYMASANTLKRNLRFDLDHYGEEARFHGLKSISLHAGAFDTTRMREALGYAVFRAAGVPAPRTAFAQVTLTVPGKYDKEFVGLYTFVEHVDKSFLKDRFKNNKGLLLKPEMKGGMMKGVEYFGEDWSKYVTQYQPKHDASKKDAQRVIEFTRLVNKSSDEDFNKQIGNYLDVDEFLRFIAVNALIANLDSFLSLGHNYYIYLNPQTNKFVFIPWDLDLSFAAFPMMGGGDQQLDLSVMHPHAGENKLIDRLLAKKDVREQYQKVLKELTTTCFAKEKLLKDIDAMDAATKEILAKEKKAVEARKEAKGFGFGGPGGMFGQTPELRTFVEKRTALVLAQLEGKSKGFEPGGFGFGGPKGGFGGGAKAGEILSTQQQDQLKLTPEQKQALAELQKDIDAKLEKLLTADQRKQLKDLRDKGFGGFGPPKGFGPGLFWAGDLVKAIDTDKDGKVTMDEVAAAVKKFFEVCDEKKKGEIDFEALEQGIAGIIPPFGGFPFGKDKEKGKGKGFPGMFGPQRGLAEGVFKQAGIDKDGKLTLEKLSSLADKLFKDADKGKKGYLVEDQIRDILNELPPPPKFGPGFGPPGDGPKFGPPGFGPGNGPEMAPAPALDREPDKKGGAR